MNIQMQNPIQTAPNEFLVKADLDGIALQQFVQANGVIQASIIASRSMDEFLFVNPDHAKEMMQSKTRADLLQALRAQQVSKLIVEYAGSGDSGGAEDITLYQGEDEVDLKNPQLCAQKLTLLDKRYDWSGGKLQEKLHVKQVDIFDLIDHFFYDVINDLSSIDFNNEGCSGSFTWDIETDSIQIDNETFFTSSEKESFTL